MHAEFCPYLYICSLSEFASLSLWFFSLYRYIVPCLCCHLYISHMPCPSLSLVLICKIASRHCGSFTFRFRIHCAPPVVTLTRSHYLSSWLHHVFLYKYALVVIFCCTVSCECLKEKFVNREPCYSWWKMPSTKRWYFDLKLGGLRGISVVRDGKKLPREKVGPSY